MLDLLKDTFKEWKEDKAQMLGAALAYFTIFSLAPLLIIAIAVTGLVFGEQAASGQIFEQIRGVVGEGAARTIEGMVANANKGGAGVIGTVVGTITLLVGAAGVFGQLKESLNIIWEAKPKTGGGIGAFIKDKFLSFTMVLGMGFLLLVSMVMSAALAGFSAVLNDLLPGMGPILRLLNFLLSLGVITLLFAMIFKVLPDVNVRWSDVWLGAFVTALLFVVGKELIGLYIGLTNVGSVYGAAGSLVVILVWIFYSAQILFFGAEFTQVYAAKRGSRVAVAAAVPFEGEARSVDAGRTGAVKGEQAQGPRYGLAGRSTVGAQSKPIAARFGYILAAIVLAVGAISAMRLRRL